MGDGYFHFEHVTVKVYTIHLLDVIYSLRFLLLCANTVCLSNAADEKRSSPHKSHLRGGKYNGKLLTVAPISFLDLQTSKHQSNTEGVLVFVFRHSLSTEFCTGVELVS